MSVLDALQAHDAQLADGVVGPVGHEPVAGHDHLVDPALRVAFLQVVGRNGAAIASSRITASCRWALRDAVASVIAAASLNTSS